MRHFFDNSAFSGTPFGPLHIKAMPLLFALFVCGGLCGCKPNETKPKETKLAGQVFIVTQGHESIKLGLVDVLLIDSQQVMNFLQTKNPEIASEQAALKNQCDATEKEFTAANDAVHEFSNNPDYLKIESERDLYMINTNTLRSYLKCWDDINYDLKIMEIKEKIHAELPGSSRTAELNSELFNVLGQRSHSVPELETNTLTTVMQVAVQLEKRETFERAKQAELAEQLEIATTNRDAARTRLETFSPSVDTYFADFSPAVFQKTTSDADGRFSFTYPLNGTFVIFAKTERMVGAKTEKYCWLVNAPLNSETATVFLSNNNLIFDDPDQLLKFKPKRTQESQTH